MITPMVARLVKEPFDWPGWLFERPTGAFDSILKMRRAGCGD